MKGRLKFLRDVPVVLPDAPEPEALDAVTVCPVCGGKLELVYDRRHISASVCVDCHTGVTIPTDAWDVARVKRNLKWPAITGRRRNDGDK